MTQQATDTAQLDMVVAELQAINNAIDELGLHLFTALSQSSSD